MEPSETARTTPIYKSRNTLVPVEMIRAKVQDDGAHGAALDTNHSEAPTIPTISTLELVWMMHEASDEDMESEASPARHQTCWE